MKKTKSAADLAAQVRLAEAPLGPLRAAHPPAQVHPGPTFAGSADIGRADADMIVGPLLLDVKAKVRSALHRPIITEVSDDGPARRGFFIAIAAACGVVVLTTVGEAYSPLARLALLAPRRPDVGPQSLPVNKSTFAAGVSTVVHDPAYRLTVTGRVRHPLSFSVAELSALEQHTARLPISCVEGWSAEADWTGVRLHDLLLLAGVSEQRRDEHADHFGCRHGGGVALGVRLRPPCRQRFPVAVELSSQSRVGPLGGRDGIRRHTGPPRDQSEAGGAPEDERPT